MKLIVGLGNPGKEYQKTRHNIGFMVVELLAEQFGGKWRDRPKWQAEVCELNYDGQKILLVKSTSFYNLTGEVVRQIGDFYNTNFTSDILIICDDLNLDFGKLRVRQVGSDGGNNGLKSVISHIGKQFWRLRIGTKNLLTEQVDNANFVLSKLSLDEQKLLPDITKNTHKLITDFLQEKLANNSQNL